MCITGLLAAGQTGYRQIGYRRCTIAFDGELQANCKSTVNPSISMLKCKRSNFQIVRFDWMKKDVPLISKRVLIIQGEWAWRRYWLSLIKKAALAKQQR